MRRIFNLPQLKQTRRRLRNDRSPAEHILWRYLKGRRLLGYKFRRQHSIGPYIVDFYSPALKLAIEIDGDSHFTLESKRHDLHRQTFICQLGIKVIRFRNDQVMQDTLGVIDNIEKFITTPTPPR